LHKSLHSVGISGITLTNYGKQIEPEWIEITYHTIPIENLPASFEGFLIVQLTDLHHSSIVTLDYLQACFREVVHLQPDLVVMTGDYITYQEKYAKPVAQALRDIILEADIPAYAVLGNHDHWNSDPEAPVFPLRNRWKGDGVEVFRALTEAGIEVLMNESVSLKRNGERLWLVGCGDYLAGHFDLERALRFLSSSDEPRILLMHNPQPIDAIAHYGFDLVLSGHTHGGQIALPFVPAKIRNTYLAGLFNVGRSKLYVCRGLGVIGAPIRFMAPPEIACFRLTSGDVARNAECRMKGSAECRR
jgi:hypothetical protein